jgi:glycosyltransferase involved in cell wall biosynthesis
VRVAITYDWLNQYGGGERVLTELHGLFPDAPIYTALYDPSRLPAHMQGWDVRPSFLQRIPFAARRHQPFLPLMPTAFEEFDLSEYDLVLTMSSACAKGVITPPGTLNLCYCLTPCRYIWDLYHEYTRGLRLRPLIAPVAQWLRMWDQLSSERVDDFMAISHEVASRIRRHYRRDAEVIYPPVEVDRFAPSGRPAEDFYLVVSRHVAYKRLDLAVEAANRLGRRLVVVGDGPQRRRLEALAGPTVEFIGRQSDEQIASLYARCRALLFPGWEDFGIAPVEAQAAGRPVIAYGRGGATETVVHGATGVFFEEQSVDSLAQAMLDFERMSFDPALCRRNAERFDRREFCHRLREAIDRRVRAARETPAVPRVRTESRDSA